MKEVGEWDIMSIFDPAKLEMNWRWYTTPPLARKCQETIGGFINIPLADFFIDKTAPCR
jgi:hypothetical protein